MHEGNYLSRIRTHFVSPVYLVADLVSLSGGENCQCINLNSCSIDTVHQDGQVAIA